MSQLSPYVREALNGWMLRGEAMPSITKLRFGLFIAGTEVAAGGYARVEVTPTTAFWSDGSGLTSILQEVTFGQPTANWGVIDQVRVFDAVADGNHLLAEINITPKTINNGDDPPVIGAGDLTFNQEPV